MALLILLLQFNPLHLRDAVYRPKYAPIFRRIVWDREFRWTL
jgi:hypothetical protein